MQNAFDMAFLFHRNRAIVNIIHKKFRGEQMKRFWIRFGIFILLWILLITQYSGNYALSILFMTAAMGLFFFLSLANVSVWLYICLSIIIASHALILNEFIYSVLLLIFLSIFAVFQLEKTKLFLYLSIHFVLIPIIMFNRNDYLLEGLLLYSFIMYLIIALSRYMTENSVQEDSYEQLQSDYRQLKRMNVSAERAARLEERTRITRDLHDSVGHRLTALIMKLEMLAIQKKDPEYRELKQMAEESLEETREAVTVLQAEDNEGISTVVQLIRKLESESHLLVQFTLKQGVLTTKLSNEKNIRLYRVIQEALTNAMRHTGSRDVHITLGRSAIGEISFEVRNRIYDPKPFTHGFGLQNMKRRVEEIGGQLSINQTADQFVVSGSFPIDEEG